MADNKPQTAIPTLHYLSSSQSFPVLMALEEISAARSDGLKYSLKKYARQQGSAPQGLKAIHPLGKSPIMVVEPAEGVSGEIETLTESRFILQYISDTYSTGEWVPSTPEDRKRDLFFQEFAKSTVQMKTNFTLLFDIIPSFLPFGLKQLVRLMVSPMVNRFSQDLAVCYRYMESYLSEDKPWLSGPKIGLADFNMLFGIETAIQRNFLWDPSKYPHLAAWHKAMSERESYQRALEKGEDGMFDLVMFK